jgi:hypothetical protein
MEQSEHRPQPDYQADLRAYQAAVERFTEHPTETNMAAIIEHEARLVAALEQPGKFELGLVVATPGALQAIEEARHIPHEFLLRHKQGDWGDVGADDAQANEHALKDGSRLFSLYHTRHDQKLYVITEWDRSATTILKPDEY